MPNDYNDYNNGGYNNYSGNGNDGNSGNSSQYYFDQNNNYNNYYQNSYNAQYAAQNSWDPMRGNASPYAAAQQQTMRYSMKDVMARTFLFMTIALLLTAITSLAVYTTNPYFLIQNGMTTFWVLAIVEIGIVIGATFAMKANNAMLSGVLFVAYSIINGLTLSVIFLVYTEGSIAKVFFLTAGLFGVMAIVGFTTDRDLTSFGTLLMIGLFGIIIASIINIFLKSSGLDYILCILGIAIFLGLTAYDTQKIKKLAMNNPGYSLSVIAMYGALELYLDFINLFLRLLQLLGKKN